TLITTALAMVAMLIVSLTLVPGIYRWSVAISTATKVEAFAQDTFIGMAAYYHNFANSNGCYTVIPPSTTTGALISKGLLDARYSSNDVFNSSSATLSFSASGATGRVDSMSIVLSFPSFNANRLTNIANMTAQSANSVTLQKPLKSSRSSVVIQNLDSNLCRS
ncbi:hypothetical protein, partial [Vibrio sp.]|uniref:hypothetical protein n=1 Tax=Vibrio sp. TaxID=678 RepID=UPI003D0E98F5